MRGQAPLTKTRTLPSALTLALLAAWVACGPEEREGAAIERDRVLGPFLAKHWKVPIAPQGPPPEGFQAVEASLEPATCGACHPKQLAEWRTSLHARAYSPGFSGQLIEGSLSGAAAVRQCQRCHAPLAEQQPFDAGNGSNATYDAGLRERGIVCASCHVRVHRTYGPPRRAELPEPKGRVAHGGFEARAEFQESRFCAECHQFFDDEGINGKPLENTWAEWAASPMAASGRTCQSCHMPDRAHLWRGIHDPEMVRSAVDVALVPREGEDGRVRAALVLANRDAGHAFPTYVTPRVFLAMWQVGADGRELEGTRVDAQVGRYVDFDSNPWREVFDTRVQPGKSVKLDYDRPQEAAAAALVGRVTVDPDHYYRGVYAVLLQQYKDPEAKRRIAEAARAADESKYILAEERFGLF